MTLTPGVRRRIALLVDVVVALVALPVLVFAMGALTGRFAGGVELLLVLIGLTTVVVVRQGPARSGSPA